MAPTSALRLVRNLDSRDKKMEHESCRAAGTELLLFLSRERQRYLQGMGWGRDEGAGG